MKDNTPNVSLPWPGSDTHDFCSHSSVKKKKNLGAKGDGEM